MLIYLIKHRPVSVVERVNALSGDDLWIACHALAEDAVLVTNNTREFERIAGLRLDDWV
jgi:tRNA(fMet)-specific endonuclease VapC